MRRTRLVLGALALLALGACSGDSDPSASPSASPPTTTVPTTTISAPTTPPASTLPPGCASPTPAASGATVITASVAGGKVTTASRRYDVRIGTRVRIEVTADVADEVHVHSYDLHAGTKPGCPAVVDLEARVPGTVEVELEDAGLLLFEIRAR